MCNFWFENSQLFLEILQHSYSTRRALIITIMAGQLRFVKTQRGRPGVEDENRFVYTLNGKSDKTTRYRCSKRSCSATLVARNSTGNLVGDSLPEHNHTNKLMKTIAKATEKKLVDQFASLPGAQPSTVLQEISANMLASECPGQIGSASSAGAIRMQLWRQRQVFNPRPKIPKNHAEYMATENVPDQYLKTADKGEFVIFKDWVDNEQTECMVMFMSDWGAQILKTHSTWLFDGTFNSCPAPFAQLYVCMAAPQTGGGQGIPVGWFLLPNKKATTYEIMFKALLNKLGGQPDSLTKVVSDFESAVFKAIRTVMKNIVHSGCRFHKNAAIWKNLGEHGLLSLYHKNPVFQDVIHKMYSLCYFRVEDVVPVYREHILPVIVEHIDSDEDWQEFEDELHEFGDYYESTWIERRNHRAPRFPPALWNHHDSVLQDEIETNNFLESYNRTWNKLAGKDSNVWKVQELFVKQEANARRAFIANRTGLDMSTNTGRKERSLDRRAAVKFILDGYDILAKKDLLDMLAHQQQI